MPRSSLSGPEPAIEAAASGSATATASLQPPGGSTAAAAVTVLSATPGPAVSSRCSRSGSVSSCDGGPSCSASLCEATAAGRGSAGMDTSTAAAVSTSASGVEADALVAALEADALVAALAAPALRVPGSPGRDIWRTEPPSIDEPLLLLVDEESHPESGDDLVARLREELSEARAAAKRDRAALEAAESSLEEAERERDDLHVEWQRLGEETRVLRLQLEDHHGIMAADWAQTLGFQERLRQEEMVREGLAEEAAELRAAVTAQAAEAATLRADAEQWQCLTRPHTLLEASSAELDALLDVAAPALSRLQSELHQRSRLARIQLHNELEQQLCVVCRDEKKTVLFLPCSHICVCEGCRGRLRPYRCPMCQEPVQSFVGRVHF